MNKTEIHGEYGAKGKLLNEKTKRVLLFALVSLTLLFAVWKVFFSQENDTQSVMHMSETEMKISRLLREIEGVGEANIAICESENGVESVVVVCEGARDFSVTLTVREAVATALGIEQKAVKIYLKE